MNTTMTYAAVNRFPTPPPVVARSHGADAIPRKQITGHGALGFLPEEDLRTLMQWASPMVLPRREVVVRAGDPGSTVILVLEGYVKLSTLVDGREIVLEIVGPGGLFGEVAVLNRWPRDADATTLSRCRLVAIDGRQFRQTLERRPEGLLAIMRLVSERLQKATERAVDALAMAAPARLAKVLIQLARLRSASLHQGDNVRLRLSQSELGSMTGLTRESVNKHLSTWRDAGWVLLSGGSVTVIDVPALSNLLEE